MKRSICVLVLLGAVAMPAAAQHGPAHFAVSAVVPARAVLETVGQPPQLALSEDDIARGYKNVQARYRVRSNDPRGYLLQLRTRAEVVRRVEVRGPSEEIVLPDDGVELHYTAAEGAHEFQLEFRFTLEAGTRPGAYPLPVVLTVAPL